MMRGMILSAVALFALVMGFNANVEGVQDKDDKEKPKYTIKQVMKEAHSKGGLLSKVAAGDADKEDRVKLAELYKALMQNKPPAGDEEKWKETTTVMHKIAEDAIKDPADGKKLKVMCAACHKEFKKK
jgi:hypothetical protein